MTDKYNVPANEKVQYFVLDYGRSKEVYTAWFYRELPLDYASFNHIVQDQARACAAQSLSSNTPITNDWKMVESLIDALESVGFERIKPNTIWLATYMNDMGSSSIISYHPSDAVKIPFPLLVRSFHELYQDSFEQALVDLTSTDAREVESALCSMNHAPLGFEEVMDWFDKNAYAFVGFHNTFFGCSQRISSYWSEILGEPLHEQMVGAASVENPTPVPNPPSFKAQKDEDLPF